MGIEWGRQCEGNRVQHIGRGVPDLALNANQVVVHQAVRRVNSTHNLNIIQKED